MIQIKKQELRDAVQAAYEFDKENGVLIDSKDIGKYWQETYEFGGKIKTYYFDSGELFCL